MIRVSWLWLVCFSVFVFGTAEASSGEAIRLYDTQEGRQLTTAELADRVGAYDILLFGEYHDNKALHNLEVEFLQAIYKQQPQLTLSLEMFERDVQPEVNAYLGGKITEQAFLEQTRPWKNYTEDYRALVEFAKTKGIPVLAANLPRSIASQYARVGDLGQLEDAMRQYLPAVHQVPDGEYRTRFFDQLRGMEAHGGMPMTTEKMAAFYRAQCLKDDTMAESIVSHYRQTAGSKLLHYQGDFHGRFRLGVYEKIKRLDPSLRIMLITPQYVPDFADLGAKARESRADGDIVLFVKPGE